MNPQFRHVRESVEALCRECGADRFFLLTDSNVAGLTGSLFPSVPRLVVEAGEGSKSLDGAAQVWKFLTDGGALRRSLLVNLGGGMVSDLGGFAAASFKRGIRYVNLPTTLLAAVDASVGGKTGINFGGLKNQIGAFARPLAVIPLTSLFGSLSESEWLSGVGEALKTGLLCGEDLFELASSREFVVERRPDVVEAVVRACVEFKESVVAEDYREGGRRRILNLGHTFGHAVEEWHLSRGRYIPHGIAVAYGLEAALRKSVELAGLNPVVLERYEAIVRRWFPPLLMSEEELEEARQFMAFDKKNERSGTPSWVLLRDFGNAF